jgi:hypothetical protein
MHLADLTSVVGKEVVPDILEVTTELPGEETQNLAVMVKELLLGGDAATTELLLEVLKQLRVLLDGNGSGGHLEGILGAGTSLALRSAEITEEFAGILITVVDADRAAAQSDVLANGEIGRLVRHLRAILSDDHLALEENTLGTARVGDLRLNELDGAILKVVEDGQLSNAVVLEAGLDNGFFEVTVETEDL